MIGDVVLMLVGMGNDRAVMIFFAIDCGGWRKDVGEIVGWHLLRSKTLMVRRAQVCTGASSACTRGCPFERTWSE